jgi:hypothetical protein
MIATRVYRWLRLGAAAGFGVVAAGCAGKGSSRTDSSSANGSIAAGDTASSDMTLIRGTVVSVSATTLGLQTDSGTTNVRLTQPLRVYDRAPARLEDITPNTFVGVTTVKQSNGTDSATEIHIFPAELRGLGEGSRPMTRPTARGGAPSTMTNGAVGGGSGAPSTMTNGNASSSPTSQMSNGKATSVGPTIVVQYAGGSIKAKVSANTSVTKIMPTSKPLAAGDRVIVVATKRADASLSSNRVMLAR